MFFMVVYPICVLLFLYAKGTLCFHKILRIGYIATIFLVPISPFFLLLIRYMYRNIDYLLLFRSLPLIVTYLFILPAVLVLLLFFLLRTFSWWKAQDIIIVVIFVELVVNIASMVMGYSFFSFADVLIIPLVKMASIQLFVCFILLQNITRYTEKIADNSAIHVQHKGMSSRYVLIICKAITVTFLVASFFNSIVVMYFSNLSFYFAAYAYSLFSVIVGWGGLVLFYYAKNKIYNVV